MKLTIHAAIASLVLIGASAQSMADPLSFTNPYTTGGGSSVSSNPVYFGGALGYTKTDNFCNGSTGCNDSDMGWKIFAGYDVNERLAVEAGYVSVGSMSSSTNNTDVTGFELSALGKMSLNDQISLFGKAGLFKWNAKNNDGERSSADILFGAGVDYKFNGNMSLRGEWQRFNDVETKSNDTSDLDMLSAGFTYRTL